MTNQHKAIGLLAVSAVLAAGLFSAVKPAAASSLTHTLQIGQKTVIADHNDDRNYDGNQDYNRRQQFQHEQFQRQQFQREQRRREEARREEQRREFLAHRGRDSRHFDNQNNYNRDYNQNNFNQDNRDFNRHDDNR